MFKKYFTLFILVLSFLSFGQFVVARDPQNITDWYIKNFDTSITVNKDSSLLITENITADCGDLPNKHGIFRVLPTEIRITDGSIYRTPISLVSITDFNNNPYKYQTITDRSTITWKIGDPNITVSGVNYYKIVYKVNNAIRFGNKNFDELYWNLLGNYWDIGTDSFAAKIYFPNEVNSQNTNIDYYTGELGSKDKSLATYYWDDNNVLTFNSTDIYQEPVFLPGEGLTVSATFTKGIFTPYVPTFMEKYGHYFWYLSFLITIAVFIFTFYKWKKYGKDPKMKMPIPPEFGIPDNITPIQMGMILSHGTWKDKFITATIVDLAVRKFITIEQIETKVLFFKDKDILLKKNLENYDLSKVTATEKILLEKLFQSRSLDTETEAGKALFKGLLQGKKINDVMQAAETKLKEQPELNSDSVKLSSLKNSFYRYLPDIKKSAENDAIQNNWIAKEGKKYVIAFLLPGILLLFFSFWSAAFFQSLIWLMSIFFSGIILIFFGIFMPKRMQVGVDLLFRIKGFERYMRQAEDYRQQFYEKENIFDKFLPYAIVFGIAELWAKKMQLIYGDDYFKNYHPVWFVGAMSTNFDLNSFTSQLNSITTSISSSTSSSSGAGGSGGAGGGGGGGGGGGW